jgi:hypothetical protein
MARFAAKVEPEIDAPEILARISHALAFGRRFVHVMEPGVPISARFWQMWDSTNADPKLCKLQMARG